MDTGHPPPILIKLKRAPHQEKKNNRMPRDYLTNFASVVRWCLAGRMNGHWILDGTLSPLVFKYTFVCTLLCDEVVALTRCICLFESCFGAEDNA